MKRKITALLLVAALCVSVLFTGCASIVSEIEMNKDFTGSLTARAGFTEATLELLSAISVEQGGEEFDTSEFTEFTYNGVKYYGVIESAEFEGLSDLNSVLPEIYTIDGLDIIKFIECKDKSAALAFVLSGRVEVSASEYEEAMVDEETLLAIEEMAKEMAVVIDVEFPTDIEQTLGIKSDAITISKNKLTVDFVKLSYDLDGKREMFIFANPALSEKPTFESVVGFSDVTLNDWFFTQVVKMADAGLFNGKQVGKFCPKDTMTKAEFITVVARTLFEEEVINELFDSGNTWWTKYYNACLDANLFTEEQLPRDGMEETITREEMALIACGYLKNVEYGDIQEYDMNSVAQFIPDYQQIDPEMLQSAIHCYSEGIICGADDKGSFMPKKTLTRAEASTVLYRLINSDARIPANIDILQ